VSDDTVHRFLIAYDITDDLRRTHVAHTLQSYGDRIQYSVFIIDAKPAKIVRLRATLRRHMNLSEDHALICDLGPLSSSPRRLMEFLGHPPAITGQGPLFFLVSQHREPCTDPPEHAHLSHAKDQLDGIQNSRTRKTPVTEPGASAAVARSTETPGQSR